ncbi:MAG: hypothetical protein DCC73_14230 [Proteobacteria bacterium]|nr:MAG: hypothetical protein DCC73_14230 [Pseudomonadota bacterium]
MLASVEVWPLIELTHRYFRGVDTMDETLLRQCLSPQVIADHTIVGHMVGIERFLDVVRRLPAEIVTLQHYLSNHEVEMRGEEAMVRASLIAQHLVRWQGEEMLMPGGGRYTFDCRYEDDRWIIVRLRNDVTWGDPRLHVIFSPRK